jgi:anti-sigma factor RsiW
MSAARETAVCLRLDRWLTAYVDGELDAVHCLEVEDHTMQCEICCERVAMLHAAKVSTRDGASEVAPQTLRERVCRTLLDERVREDTDAADGELEEARPSTAPAAPVPVAEADKRPAAEAAKTIPPYFAKLRYIVPLAAAATIALMIGAASLGGIGLEGQPVAPSDSAALAGSAALASSAALANASFDTLLDDLVSQHAHPPQLDVTDPNEPLELRPILDTSLRGTTYEKDFGATYVGAHKTPRAGLLQYVKRDKNRVTMYVFNTRRLKVRSNKLTSRRVGARKVYVGKVRGYPVAASEHKGRGFLLTADGLSADEASNLVLAAAR